MNMSKAHIYEIIGTLVLAAVISAAFAKEV